MSAATDYCRGLEKLKSEYLQQLVNTHEEIFVAESRIEEIITEMVDLRRSIILHLQLAGGEDSAKIAALKEESEARRAELDTEVEQIGNRIGELYFRVGAYERLIKIMEEKIKSCKLGVI